VNLRLGRFIGDETLTLEGAQQLLDEVEEQSPQARALPDLRRHLAQRRREEETGRVSARESEQKKAKTMPDGEAMQGHDFWLEEFDQPLFALPTVEDFANNNANHQDIFDSDDDPMPELEDNPFGSPVKAQTAQAGAPQNPVDEFLEENVRALVNSVARQAIPFLAAAASNSLPFVGQRQSL
jgi:hypothetical protein